MKILWMIFVFFMTTIAQAETITCHQSNPGIRLEVEEKYSLKISDKPNCSFSFWLEKNIDGKNSWGVFAGPIESDFGPNAQTLLYIKKSKSIEFQYAGSLPVAAENISSGKYKHIWQEGGSIYSNYYFLKKGRLFLLNESKALLIDGQYCITPKDVKNLSDLELNAICTKIVKATPENPICTTTKENRTKTRKRINCFDLEAKASN